MVMQDLIGANVMMDGVLVGTVAAVICTKEGTTIQLKMDDVKCDGRILNKEEIRKALEQWGKHRKLEEFTSDKEVKTTEIDKNASETFEKRMEDWQRKMTINGITCVNLPTDRLKSTCGYCKGQPLETRGERVACPIRGNLTEPTNTVAVYKGLPPRFLEGKNLGECSHCQSSRLVLVQRERVVYEKPNAHNSVWTLCPFCIQSENQPTNIPCGVCHLRGDWKDVTLCEGKPPCYVCPNCILKYLSEHQ